MMRRLVPALAATFLSSVPALAAWPFLWDGDQRGDTPVATVSGPSGDLYVLVESNVQTPDPAHGVVLRIAADGTLVWAAHALELTQPRGLAVAPDGSVLAVGRGVGSGLGLYAASFADDGSPQWTQVRSDVEWEPTFFGTEAQPSWDPGATAWRMPLRKDDGFLVASYDAAGTALADWTWVLPTGTGGASAVRPRTDGGMFVAGTYDGDPTMPGWWIVASDATGAELWRHFDDGGTAAGVFSLAFFVDSPEGELIAWADDETACGIPSLRVWSLDPVDGSERWARTWPEGTCLQFSPDTVVRSGDRLLASGSTNAFGPFGETGVVALDAATGQVAWERSFDGGNSTIVTTVTGLGGAALAASTLFASPNPGPTPLWISTWKHDGSTCASPQQLQPSRVIGSTRDADGRWWIVGSHTQPGTLEDVVVQTLDDPCAPLFADDFETGDLSRWSTALP